MADKKLPAFSDIEDRIDMILEGSEEMDEAVQEELLAELESLGIKEADKIDGFAQFMKLRKAKIEAIRKEAAALSARARSMESSLDWIKVQYLKRMDASGIQKIRGNAYSISVQERATAVVPTDLSELPEEYVVTKVEQSPNKTLILTHLQAGVEIPGCSIGKSRYIVAR